MKITNITVGFKRSRRPADYETCEAQVEFSAALDEGEELSNQDITLLDRAAQTVYNRLGMKDPQTGKAPAPKPAPAAEPEAKVEDDSEELSPQQKAARTRAANKAKKEAEEAEAAKEKEASEDFDPTSGSDETGASEPQKTDDGIDVTDGAAAEPEKKPEPKNEDIGDAELQQAAGTAARTYGKDKVKEAMSEFGVARLGELPKEKRADFVAALEKLGE